MKHNKIDVIISKLYTHLGNVQQVNFHDMIELYIPTDSHIWLIIVKYSHDLPITQFLCVKTS